MNDMSSTIIAKSDQINAADLIGTSRTITVKEVRIKAGEDQPVSIMIEGDKKAFRPCKGVRRLLVRVWGPDANKYIGQSLTIYCDPSATWAGQEAGGIRVSHMSGMDEKIVEFMRTSRAATKPYEIFPLGSAPPANKRQTAAEWAVEQVGAAKVCANLDSLAGVMERGAEEMGRLEGSHPKLWASVNGAYAKVRAALDTDTGDGFADEGEGA